MLLAVCSYLDFATEHTQCSVEGFQFLRRHGSDGGSVVRIVPDPLQILGHRVRPQDGVQTAHVSLRSSAYSSVQRF